MKRPTRNEYEDYYHRYVKRVPDGDIVEILSTELELTLACLAGVDESKSSYRYAEGKWSLKEVVGHLVDVERMFGFRMLSFLRSDSSPLPSFDQDAYVENARFDSRTLADLVEEFRHVRLSHIPLILSIDDKEEVLSGVASGFTFSVRSIPYIMVGHEIHHRGVIEGRYLEGKTDA